MADGDDEGLKAFSRGFGRGLAEGLVELQRSCNGEWGLDRHGISYRLAPHLCSSDKGHMGPCICYCGAIRRDVDGTRAGTSEDDA